MKYLHRPTDRIAKKVVKRGGPFEDYYYTVDVNDLKEKKTQYLPRWVVENSQDWKEIKDPIHTTKDGKSIYENQKVAFFIQRLSGIWEYLYDLEFTEYHKNIVRRGGIYEVFITKQDGEKWMEFNEKKYSEADIIAATKKCIMMNDFILVDNLLNALKS